MHRFLMQPPPGMQIDHINGDGLDNRRCNLRLATNTQNRRNGKAHSDGTSRFKGVCWDKFRGRWRADITFENRSIHLGRFHSETDAAIAYDAAARDLFGEFARLNQIGTGFTGL